MSAERVGVQKNLPKEKSRTHPIAVALRMSLDDILLYRDRAKDRVYI